MRIIAGNLRGRPLQSPAGAGTRPTADRARETLFSMLASRIGSFDDLAVADLFAGSGALGFEALSRGAARATFVESEPNAAAAIARNAATFGVSVDILRGSALALPRREPFDLIFADPPYAKGLGSAVVAAIAAADWLAHGGWLTIETERGAEIDHGLLVVDTIRNAGRAQLTLLRRP